jgi:pimeloyl-ACP methyl ester carboxylesterase
MQSGKPLNDSPPQAPAWLPDERADFVDVGGLRLLCRQWGNAGAPPIVLLHGLRGFSGTWRALARSLSHEFRMIAFDQRGRGDSDWDPDCNYYTDAYLGDLEAIVDHLGLQRFTLLGHSMGGTTSYVYADRHPERLTALIIEDIAPGSSTQGDGARRIVAEMAGLPESFSSWAEARSYWRAQRPSLPDDALEQRLAESLRSMPDGRIAWRYDARGISKIRIHPDPSRIVDLWPIADRLKVRTLIVHGERSDFCPAVTVAEMCRRNSNISAIAVPNASHYVHDDAPELFKRHVREFLHRE